MALISEIRLTALIATATFMGAVAGPVVSGWLLSADAKQQTDVQLIEIAIGVLATAKDPSEDTFSPEAIALRQWSVDTINSAATVKIEGTARDSLINGKTTLARRSPLPARQNGEKPWDRNVEKRISDEDLRALAETFQRYRQDQE